ncbi:MAG: hypothetical protein ACNI25_15295 [Halarcobacter sp.]
MRKSLLLAKVLLGATVLFTGCGGGGGGGVTTSLSTVSGIVSDGPIKNVRVFLDIDNDGVYDEGEPYDITDANGKYEISYILKPGIEYILIAEGSTALQTEDTTTDNTGLLNFSMFLNIEVSGNTDDTAIVGKTYKKNISPTSFKNYLEKLEVEDNTLAIFNDANVQNILGTTSKDETLIFQSWILDNQSDGLSNTVSGTISTKNTNNINSADNSKYIYTLPDNVAELSKLKTSLISGNLLDSILGISPIIDTKIAFQIMDSYNNTSEVIVDANGIKKTISYIKKGDIVTAVFEETVSSSTLNAKYIGTVIFKIANNVSTLLSANYLQEHTQTSNLAKKNSVSGVIELSKANNGYNLNLLNGTFAMNTPLYGDIDGEVTIKGATTAVPFNSDVNDNTIENTTTYTIKTKTEPIKTNALYPASLVGVWSGNLTSTCTQAVTTMTLSTSDEYTASWQAQSNNQTYGTNLSVVDSKITFKDNITTNNTTWSVGTISNNQITGDWKDTLNKCTGTYTLNKQGVK